MLRTNLTYLISSLIVCLLYQLYYFWKWLADLLASIRAMISTLFLTALPLPCLASFISLNSFVAMPLSERLLAASTSHFTAKDNPLLSLISIGCCCVVPPTRMDFVSNRGFMLSSAFYNQSRLHPKIIWLSHFGLLDFY